MATPALRWAVLGASDIAATRMIPAFRAAGHEVVVVQSGDADWGSAYATTHGIPKSTTSVDEAVGAAVDAVYVGSHNDKHRDQILAAAAASRHVLAEKPLALNVAEARAAVEACRRAGVVMATNHHLPASPTHRTVKRLVAEGAVGEVRAIRVSHAVGLPAHLKGWRLGDPVNGGVLLDVLVHDLAAIAAIIGGQARQIASLARTDAEVPDSVMSVATWDGDVIVQTHDAYDNYHLPTSLSVLGTDGAVAATGCMTGDPIGDVAIAVDNKMTPVDVGPRDDLYFTTVRAFEQAVREGTSPLVTGEDGVRSLAGVMAAQASLMSGRVEDVERT